MKTLIKYGLENPSIKSMNISSIDGERESQEFRLYCDNYTSNNLLAKKFSFFEQLFNSFLIKEFDNLYKKLEKIIIIEEEREEKEDTADIILPTIEEEFEKYLKQNEEIWKKEYQVKMSLPYNFTWLKASSPTTIIPSAEDMENECLFLCLIPESLKNIIQRSSKQVETRAINVLYSEKIFNVVPNIYYCYIGDSDLTKRDFHHKVKQHIMSENIVIYIISTNSDDDKQSKQNVYLYNFLLGKKEDSR